MLALQNQIFFTRQILQSEQQHVNSARADYFWNHKQQQPNTKLYKQTKSVSIKKLND